MPWPVCAPCHSLPDGGGGNRPPSGQPNVPANSRQSGLRVPLAASSPRYLALTNIRRRSQSLPAATFDRHRPPSTPNRARTIALPCPYRPFRCCIVIPSVDLGISIQVQAPDGVQLPEGLSAVATVVIREDLNVLLVPIDTLYGTFDQPVVRIKTNGQVQERPVTLGNSDDGRLFR